MVELREPTSSSRITDIFSSLQMGLAPLHVLGTNVSVQALILQRLKSENIVREPIIVVCPTSEDAENLFSDLDTLSDSRFRIAHLTGWEHSPYSPISPSIRVRHQRLHLFSECTDKSPPDFIISTLPALLQATMPREMFQSLTFTLSLNSEIESREIFARRLTALGYQRVETVEDPGTFAIRGEIIDVFIPGASYPVRLELFDTTVERIRAFDPNSQKSFTALEKPSPSHLRIIPAREVLLNPETCSRLREQLKARGDELAVSRVVRDPILHAIQGENYLDHTDTWAAFAFTQPGCALDFFEGARWITSDELSIRQNWDVFLADQKEMEKQAPQAGLIPPLLDQTFFPDKAEALLKTNVPVLIHFDRLEMADLTTEPTPPPETAKKGEPILQSTHRVAIKHNRDFLKKGRHAISELEPLLSLWKKQGFKITIIAPTQSQMDRISYLLREREIVDYRSVLGQLSEGFRWPAEGCVYLTESEILGAKHVQKSALARRKSSANFTQETEGEEDTRWSDLQSLSDLSPGDTIVHADHGIGRYQGLVRLDLNGAPNDFLCLEYAQKDKLYLPVYRLNVIQKYAGGSDAIALDRLGAQSFQKTKEKVREAVKKLAVDLVQLYAQRATTPGVAFAPRDADVREFESKFAFNETPDQQKAVDKILDDLSSGKMMDRLVCGDVGYGKTEVAMRAAFRAVTEGKQVAVLTPTTVLAFQHEQSFKARFKDYPVRIEGLSRFKSAAEQKKTLELTGDGQVDIVIGTHRLLSKDVVFRDLALVIVDEEHRFGVEHKEKLKALKINTHVLTLTATPIPRTLHMTLSGLREISLINTPPVNRLPIRTAISRFDEDLIRKAVTFEIARGGQVFFLHNRVQTIEQIATKIRELCPQATVGVAHGQMAEGALEKMMLAFFNREFQVLVCTTIIESGLDVPNANTMIINRADSLGLAQLYQIRGRVGRGQQRAYAYLLIPNEGAISEDAKRRLEVIQKFVELGSGFQIASHDLEIRGGGDILGPQQSGHIAAVGFDLYIELLEEAIQELKSSGPATSPTSPEREPEIKSPYSAFLSEEYVPDIHQRLALYRRLSASKNESDVVRLEQELVDRFGNLPAEAQNLLWTIRLKIFLKEMGVEQLTVGNGKVSLKPSSTSPLDPVKVIGMVSAQPQRFQITPDSKLVANVNTDTLKNLFLELESVLSRISVTPLAKPKNPS